MSDLIDREQALSLPMANGKYDHENADEHFINGLETYREWIAGLPVIEVIHCKDCRFYHTEFDGSEPHCEQDYWCYYVEPNQNDFCSLAERREK